MKRYLILFLLFTGFNATSFGQMKAEPQPFPLTDYKISFYEIQMNSETVKVTEMDGSKITGNQPKIIVDDATDSFIIDFTDCAEGEYLISAKRDDLELEYSVNR
ncbi:hypothetical protein [Crocinitomix catalasitica]|uniref:hypothetical protein n=1 Tax=Crocinitomix catalasitica TaxID=184607 RepID=UPI0004869E00|nr:hypothetical protein [Crocinitomix catalasitica]